MKNSIFITSIHAICSLLIAVFFLSSCASEHSNRIDIEADLAKLDTVVADYQIYEQEKIVRLNQLKRNLVHESIKPNERYEVCRKLVIEYLKFNPDSAEAYALLAKKIAQQGRMDANYTEAKLFQAMVVIFRGDEYKARLQLDSIGSIDKMQPSVRQAMAMACMDFYIRNSDKPTGITPHLDQQGKKVWLKYSRFINSGSWVHFYYRCLLYDNSRVMRKRIRALLCRNITQPSVAAASLYYALSMSYASEGRHSEELHCLIMSAINDIKSANRDAQSLVRIINTGNSYISRQRAFNYMMLSTRNAYIYKDFGRSYDILAAHSRITQGFSEDLIQHSHTLTVIVVLLFIALTANIIMFVIIEKKRCRQRRLIADIKRKNVQLKEMIEKDRKMQLELKKSNEKLLSEIEQRNRNFIEVYRLITSYVKDEEKFRKSLFNLITVGKTEKVKHELMSDNNTEYYLQGFYEQFDKAFLISHPDFIDRFNTLLRPECQITLEEKNRLTPELRIYALIALGVTDSRSIATFLHYSPQTIYNYRLRMRKRACISEKKFAETTACIYTTTIVPTNNDA